MKTMIRVLCLVALVTAMNAALVAVVLSQLPQNLAVAQDTGEDPCEPGDIDGSGVTNLADAIASSWAWDWVM